MLWYNCWFDLLTKCCISKKKEGLRKEKYLKHLLEEKRIDIRNALNEQKKFLNENFLDLNSIISNIKNDSNRY